MVSGRGQMNAKRGKEKGGLFIRKPLSPREHRLKRIHEAKAMIEEDLCIIYPAHRRQLTNPEWHNRQKVFRGLYYLVRLAKEAS